MCSRAGCSTAGCSRVGCSRVGELELRMDVNTDMDRMLLGKTRELQVGFSHSLYVINILTSARSSRSYRSSRSSFYLFSRLFIITPNCPLHYTITTNVSLRQIFDIYWSTLGRSTICVLVASYVYAICSLFTEINVHKLG